MSFGVSVPEHAQDENITQETSDPPAGYSDAACWYLEGYVDDRKALRRVPLRPSPFRVGRKSDLPLRLNFANISRVHAELYYDANTWFVRDLDSRNGTFVNRERIYTPTALRTGDIIHFGNVEFRVGYEGQQSSGEFGDTMDFSGVLPAEFVTGTPEFLELMRTGAVCSLFQPLVWLADRRLFGYEALGRGQLPGIAENPYELFKIAATVGLEEELSRLFRRKAVQTAATLSGNPNIFLNIHPSEMRDPKLLLAGLDEFRRAWPSLQLTLEVHESLVTDPHSMHKLAAEIRARGYYLAYDDFGAGQARLMELAEAPPDYLKFDRSLLRNIHKATSQRQQMVEVLVRFARDVGVTTLAEGIELPEEARVCEQIGFQAAQGYFFGRPAAVTDFTATRSG